MGARQSRSDARHAKALTGARSSVKDPVRDQQQPLAGLQTAVLDREPPRVLAQTQRGMLGALELKQLALARHQQRRLMPARDPVECGRSSLIGCPSRSPALMSSRSASQTMGTASCARPSPRRAVSSVRWKRVSTQTAIRTCAMCRASCVTSSRPRPLSGTGIDGSPLMRPSTLNVVSPCRTRMHIVIRRTYRLPTQRRRTTARLVVADVRASFVPQRWRTTAGRGSTAGSDAQTEAVAPNEGRPGAIRDAPDRAKLGHQVVCAL